jgi:putative transposase
VSSNTEVGAKGKRRIFTAADKSRIIAEYQKAASPTERFCDLSVREIYATLLDEGIYLGSISTMYRVLRAAGESRERRALAKHPTMVKPELAATAPGQVWSWDITKLLGPQKWTYYYLYVVLDVFSRYVVAWRLETRESAELARNSSWLRSFGRTSMRTSLPFTRMAAAR